MLRYLVLLLISFAGVRAPGTPAGSSAASGLPRVAPLLSSVPATPRSVPARVRGSLPRWLRGSLLRVGPGKFEFGEDR